MSDLISRQETIDELKTRFDGCCDTWIEMRDLVIDAIKDIHDALENSKRKMGRLQKRSTDKHI